MLLGVLIARNSYTVQRYFFVLLMVAGVALFIFNKNKDRNNEEKWFGYLIVGFSLLCDGFTGSVQDVMRKKSKPSTMNFMFYVNAWSSLILICIMAVSGEGRAMINFAIKYPEIIWKLALAIVCTTFGQIFISAMITHFGS